MNINEPTVFLDMDGVLVDFFSAFAKLLDVEHWKQMDSTKVARASWTRLWAQIIFAKLPKTNDLR